MGSRFMVTSDGARSVSARAAAGRHAPNDPERNDQSHTTFDRFRRDPARATLAFLGTWVPVSLLLVWTFLPFLVTLSISLKARSAIFLDVGLIPDQVEVRAYQRVLESDGFRRAFTNSVVLGFTTLFLTVALSAPAAYAFAKLAFRGRQLMLIFVLVPLFVPKVGLMLPLYALAVRVNGIDSFVMMTIVFTGTLLPLTTFLMVGFFQAIPLELEEAAAVDGASLWQRIRRIVFPLSLPALITVGVLCFREAWTEFDLVLALTTSSAARTLPYELFLASDSAGLPDAPAEAAFAVLTVVPFLLVYSRIERYVSQGFLSGSVK